MQEINLEFDGDPTNRIESQTLQESAYAEFDDICPDWAENIRRGDGFSSCDKSFQDHNIMACESCLVGEAHS